MLDLTINYSTSSTYVLMIYQGDSVLIANNIYYFGDTDTLTSSNGGDSFLTSLILLL